MKKVFLILIAVVAMVSVQAANTEVARLTLTGQGSVAASYITLRVDPAVLTPETSSYYENTELPDNVNIYVKVGGDKFSAYKFNDLTNLAVAFVTNRTAAGNQHYTITFNVPTSTEGLKLKDLRTGTVTDIVNAGTYEFDVNTTTDPGYVAGTNYVIEDRFVINYVVPDFEICFRDNELQITANPYAENVVVKDENGTKVVDVAPVTPYQAIDLSAQAAGRYTVELADGARKFIIVKQ